MLKEKKMKKRLLVFSALFLVQISVESQIGKGRFESYVYEYSGENHTCEKSNLQHCDF